MFINSCCYLKGLGNRREGDGSFKSRWQLNQDYPRTGAVPGLCGANHCSFMARKLLGQLPMTLGTVLSLLQRCLTEH